MTDHLREVLALGARRTVRIGRTFGAPPVHVWSALVEPERVARWLAELELGADDAYVLTFSAQDGSQVSGRVLECVPHAWLLLSMDWDDGPASELAVTLSAAGTGTDLVLEHRGLPALGAPEYGSGWESHFELLAAELQRGTGWTGEPVAAVPTGFDEAIPAFRALEAAAVAGVVVRGPVGGVELGQQGRPGGPQAADGAGVRLARVLDAPLDQVWAACTRPEQLGRWLWPVLAWPGEGPRSGAGSAAGSGAGQGAGLAAGSGAGSGREPGAAPKALEPGDRIVFADVNMPGGRLRFDVLEIDPPFELVVAWGPDLESDRELDRPTGPPPTRVRFALSESGTATLLTIEQDPAAEVFGAGRLRGGADFAAGWHSLVDALGALLTGQTSPGAKELWEAAYSAYGGASEA